jgi:hypothetical protein
MTARTSNIAYMVLGLLLVLIYVFALLHHQYEFFDDSFEEAGWISYLFFLLGGVWFVVFGLIGLVRLKQGKRSE